MILISNIVLNPSIDKTCIVEDLEIGQSNTIIDQRMDIGGEGINVTRLMKILQSEPMVLSFLAGLNGRYIKSSLDKAKIRSNFTWVNGDTKLNTLFIDSVNGTRTLLKDEGVTISEKDYLRFRQEMKNYIKDSAVVLINGKLNGGLDFQLYDDVVEHAKRFNTKIVIATDGEELRKAFTYKPYALCIKEEHLKELNLHTTTEEETLTALIAMMKEYSIHYVAIDQGESGALLLSKHKICQGVPSVKIEPFNKRGGFSALLAAFTVGIERKYELEKILKLMVATSLAVMQHNDKYILCSKSDIDYLVKKVKIEERMNQRSGWIV